MYTWIEIPENELKEMFMNYSVTAEKMYVHINTIRKRIDKVNDYGKGFYCTEQIEHTGKMEALQKRQKVI